MKGKNYSKKDLVKIIDSLVKENATLKDNIKRLRKKKKFKNADGDMPLKDLLKEFGKKKKKEEEYEFNPHNVRRMRPEDYGIGYGVDEDLLRVAAAYDAMPDTLRNLLFLTIVSDDEW